MKGCFRKVGFVLVALVFVCSRVVYADEGEHSEKMDAVLLLDASGSMLLNDPNRLKEEGAKLFVQLLRTGDRLAIIKFAEQSQIVQPLFDFNREQISGISETIDKVKNNGQYTNLLAPIKQAAKILDETGRPDAERVIILLSDGKMEPREQDGTPEALTDELLDETLPRLKQSGIKVYTLSLSKDADTELLSKIASDTFASHWYTESADDIHKSFADLFLTVKKPQMIPLTGRGFLIDPDIEEATFYISNDTGSKVLLKTPTGVKISERNVPSSVKWYSGSKFSVITITSPAAGQWEVEGISSPDGFIAVMTNLKLSVDWPKSLISGASGILQARLYDAQKPVVIPEMTGKLSYRYTITPIDKISTPVMRDSLYDDGADGDKVANDGVFSRRVTVQDVGEYRLSVTAIGPTFERQQQMGFSIKPQMVRVEVIPAEESLLNPQLKLSGEQQAKEYFKVMLSPDVAAMRKVEVKLIAKDSIGGVTIPLKQIDDIYEAPVLYLPRAGKFEVHAEMSAVQTSGKKGKIQAESVPLSYEYTPQEIEESEEDEVQELAVLPTRTKVVEKKGEGSWLEFLIWWLIVTAVSAVITAISFIFLRKIKLAAEKKGASNDVELKPMDPVIAAVMALEKKSSQVEVDLSDPLFSESSTEGTPESSAAASSEASAETNSEESTEASAETQTEESSEATPQQEEESAAEGGEE